MQNSKHFLERTLIVPSADFLDLTILSKKETNLNTWLLMIAKNTKPLFY